MDALLLEDVAQEADEEGIQSKEGGDQDEEVLPYSFRNEAHFFVKTGLPLGLSALFEWGAPPWFAMIMAGQTRQSEHLQSALGIGRVFYNCTTLMMMFGFVFGYMSTVIPGCIGANRKDRIPKYLWRSLTLTSLCMIPFFGLQFFAGPIMHSLGVSMAIASDVSVYCRLMIVSSWLLMLECHLEIVFINLGFTRSATMNSLLTGLGVDVLCTYFFIYKWEWGMYGVALAQIVVKACRVLVWCSIMGYFGLYGTICGSSKSSKETIFSWQEFKIFLNLCVPMIVTHFSGWLIFELQIICIANIQGISAAGLAAGAIWVQMESTLASIQDGWLKCTQMRTMQLFGRQDPGTAHAYMWGCVFGFVAVAATTSTPLLLWSDRLALVVSNDPDVRSHFSKIVWVLALHSQSRICSINASILFVPIGRGIIGVALNFVCFYLVASPIAGVTALTAYVTDSVASKMVAAVSCSSIAQVLIAFLGWIYFMRLDWEQTAKLISQRANTDKLQTADGQRNAASPKDVSYVESGRERHLKLEDSGSAII